MLLPSCITAERRRENKPTRLPGYLRWPHMQADQVRGLSLREIGGGFTKHHRAPSIRAACYAIAKPSTMVQKMQIIKTLRGHQNAVYCGMIISIIVCTGYHWFLWGHVHLKQEIMCIISSYDMIWYLSGCFLYVLGCVIVLECTCCLCSSCFLGILDSLCRCILFFLLEEDFNFRKTYVCDIVWTVAL